MRRKNLLIDGKFEDVNHGAKEGRNQGIARSLPKGQQERKENHTE